MKGRMTEVWVGPDGKRKRTVASPLIIQGTETDIEKLRLAICELLCDKAAVEPVLVIIREIDLPAEHQPNLL